ncbi:MAG: hypothetical protein ABR548_13350 [Actinomycetota bacterium]|nr:hypothetical protein [Actinomycetota bacterium]
MPRRLLAAMWVLWSVWLVTRPVEYEKNSITPEGRRELAIFGFALVLLIVYGLLRTWRWPVTASRALVVALIAGVIVGPAGRPLWVYALDVVFAVAGSMLAFVRIRMGTAPPPQRSSDWTAKRVIKRREMLERRRRK